MSLEELRAVALLERVLVAAKDEEEEEEFEAQIAAIEEKRRIWKSQNT